MCEYVFRNGEKCPEEPFEGSKYCILHIELPEDESSHEFERIRRLKEEKVRAKVGKGDFNFEGARLCEVDFSGMEIEGDVNFKDAVVRGNVSFYKAKIEGNIIFISAHIKGDIQFAWARVAGHALFNMEVEGKTVFDGAEVLRGVHFVGCRFRDLTMEEQAYMFARWGWERIGVRERADEYFYKEMVTKRKQRMNTKLLKERLEWIKGRWGRAKEIAKWVWGVVTVPFEWLFADKIFGYGTRPYRVILAWFLIVSGCGGIYKWKGLVINSRTGEVVKSFWEALYFSVITATTVGYGDFHPAVGWGRVLAGAEAIIGTFMWAAFIVIFARKFMRQ